LRGIENDLEVKARYRRVIEMRALLARQFDHQKPAKGISQKERNIRRLEVIAQILVGHDLLSQPVVKTKAALDKGIPVEKDPTGYQKARDQFLGQFREGVFVGNFASVHDFSFAYFNWYLRYRFDEAMTGSGFDLEAVKYLKFLMEQNQWNWEWCSLWLGFQESFKASVNGEGQDLKNWISRKKHYLERKIQDIRFLDSADLLSGDIQGTIGFYDRILRGLESSKQSFSAAAAIHEFPPTEAAAKGWLTEKFWKVVRLEMVRAGEDTEKRVGVLRAILFGLRQEIERLEQVAKSVRMRRVLKAEEQYARLLPAVLQPVREMLLRIPAATPRKPEEAVHFIPSGDGEKTGKVLST